MKNYTYNVSFRNLHPTRTAGRRHRGIDIIRDDMQTDGRESKYVSCRQCGFSGCNTDRDAYHYHTGYGLPPMETVTAGSTSVTRDAKRGGCPNCFSEFYV